MAVNELIIKGTVIGVVDQHTPSLVDAVSDDEIYTRMEIAGAASGGVFTESPETPILIKRYKVTGTLRAFDGVRVKWADRANGALNWFPWEFRGYLEDTIL